MLVFNILGSLAQFERDLIRERTNAGLKAARERGSLGGRRPVITPDKLRKARDHIDPSVRKLHFRAVTPMRRWRQTARGFEEDTLALAAAKHREDLAVGLIGGAG